MQAKLIDFSKMTKRTTSFGNIEDANAFLEANGIEYSEFKELNNLVVVTYWDK